MSSWSIYKIRGHDTKTVASSSVQTSEVNIHGCGSIYMVSSRLRGHDTKFEVIGYMVRKPIRKAYGTKFEGMVGKPRIDRLKP